MKKMLGKENFQKVAKFVIRQQVSRIGNQFLSHVEIGAQEAAYLILQMHLRQSITRRPRTMIQYCYADFVSWFDTSFEKVRSQIHALILKLNCQRMNTHVNWKMIFLAWKKKTRM